MSFSFNRTFVRNVLGTLAAMVLALALLVQTSSSSVESRDPRTFSSERRSQLKINELFEVTLQFKQDSEPVTSVDDRDGKHIGGGEGNLTGARISGTLRYDVYEKGGAVTGENQCQINIAGLIDTDDGAQIKFESLGFGLIPDSDKPSEWIISAALNFNTNESRYEWLNKTIAVWDGGFNTETGQHRYRAFANGQQ